MNHTRNNYHNILVSPGTVDKIQLASSLDIGNERASEIHATACAFNFNSAESTDVVYFPLQSQYSDRMSLLI